MEYITLNNGVKMPQLGFGVFQIPDGKGYMTIDCFERAVSAPVRELFEIPGATHIQTYWKPEYVSQAAGKLVEFFGKHV